MTVQTIKFSSNYKIALLTEKFLKAQCNLQQNLKTLVATQLPQCLEIKKLNRSSTIAIAEVVEVAYNNLQQSQQSAYKLRFAHLKHSTKL